MQMSDLIGSIPHRMAFAGGWIDQPFMSQINPDPTGSMVVVAIEPDLPCMERFGMAGGTRKIATERWNGVLPAGDPEEFVRELYAEENKDKGEPSGSQDMIGLIYQGINRLDFDFNHEGGIFPLPYRIKSRDRCRNVAGKRHKDTANRSEPCRL